MTLAQEKLFGIIGDLSDKDLSEVIDFIEYLKLKKENQLYKDLQHVSESSMDFWDNDIDDEAWNNA